jgi:hypothetical protein
MVEADARVTFADVLRVGEFRALWIADAQSSSGDQLARVALSVLVFERTGSASVTALVYALTFAPAIVGGALLGGLADRLPRRTLMVACDLLRAALLGAMASPGLSVPAIAVLLVLAVLVGQPFAAAQAALLPEILAGDRYVVGSGLRMLTGQLAQLVGFAGGGIAIAAIGPRAGLAVDAVTFAVSALLIRWFVADRPPTADRPARSGLGAATRSVFSVAVLLGRDRRLLTLLGLGWLAAFHVVPEGIAPAYAAGLGGGAAAIGLLMAAAPAGTVLGVFLFVRLPVPWRVRLLGPLAIATSVPLIACAARPNLVASVLLWSLVGLFSAYQVQAATSFVRSSPVRHRGQLIGLATSGLIAMQGLGVMTFGLVADWVGASAAVAIAGIAAALLSLPLAASWSQVTRTDPRHGAAR